MNQEISVRIGDIKKRFSFEQEQARLEAEARSAAGHDSDMTKTQSSWLSKTRKARSIVRGMMLTSSMKKGSKKV